MAGIGVILWSIIEAPTRGWSSPLVIGAGAVGLAVLALFASWERITDHPMLNLSFFRRRPFSAAIPAVVPLTFGLLGALFVLTQFLQLALGFTDLQAGIRLLPIAAAVIVVAPAFRERAADNRVLGRFRLENIRPAPRGVPQIEVTFDIDANGILNVSARDKDTGTEQRITISESSNLDQSEVARMIADAEQHRDEDRRLRELTDARNELDTAAYQVEHLLAERGDSVPVHQKARAENLAADARQALKEETPAERIRSLTAELRQVYQELLSAGSPPPGGQAGPAPGGSGDGGSGGDDVIDAEFTPSE